MSIRQLLVPLVCLAASLKMQLSVGLNIRLDQSHRSMCFSGSRKFESNRTRRCTRLFSLESDNGDRDETKNNDDETKSNQKVTTPASLDSPLLVDPGLWISDFLALILASQLIGLLNVVNNPEFIRNGGWFQPIPAVPSTLDELVLRISSFSIMWAIASATVISFASTTSTIGESNTSIAKETGSDRSDTNVILKRNIQNLVIFFALQIIANWIGFELGFGNDHVNNDGFLIGEKSVIPWLDVLRNCYFVGLSTSGLRFLYGRYFLLS